MDVNGNWSYSCHESYKIFMPTEPNLFINNSSHDDWIMGYYLYGALGEFPADVWNVDIIGDTPAELYANYKTIVDAQGGGPNGCGAVYPEDPGAAAWLDESAKNLIITGDEYLSACFYGWPGGEVPTAVGDFPHDYLGITHYYSDINYARSGDQHGISRLFPVEGDIISSDLFDFLSDSLHLNYDPDYEIGESNWLDGIEVADGAMVPYYGLSGVLDEDLQLPVEVDTYEAEVGVPREFSLGQPYPNPFNPTTTIEFSMPRSRKVTLTVYDLLGREVETVLNQHMESGRHKVQWNADGVPSGIYFVRMQAGDFSQVKKVTVLR